jgi:hypothetical protein
MDKELFVRFLLQFGTEQIAITDENLAFHRHHKLSKTISEDIPFMTEYATLIHRICLKKGCKKVSELLEEKYNVKNHSYTFDKTFDSLTPEIAEQMALVMLANRFFEVYQKCDFAFGKKLLRTFHLEKLELDERTNAHLEKLRKSVKYPNWFLFRVARKLRF